MAGPGVEVAVGGGGRDLEFTVVEEVTHPCATRDRVAHLLEGRVLVSRGGIVLGLERVDVLKHRGVGGETCHLGPIGTPDVHLAVAVGHDEVEFVFALEVGVRGGGVAIGAVDALGVARCEVRIVMQAHAAPVLGLETIGVFDA